MKHQKEKWMAIGLSVLLVAVVVALLTAFSVKVLDDYGFVLFILVPIGMGITSTTIYGYFGSRTWKQSLSISFSTLLVSCGLLMMCYIEGVVCIVMASPLIWCFQYIGTLVGHRIQARNKNTIIRMFCGYIVVIPILLGIESEVAREGDVIKVSSSVTIEAPIDSVWKYVIAFPEIPKPEEWLFKRGVAYPISSSIVGEGEQATRYCEFTTGAFVEPIEVWDEPNLLSFSVKEQPVPLTSMMDEKVPGNMYKYFVSTRGEFRLQRLNDHATILTGSTWYYHKIRPVNYWKWWSDYIIHKIHYRVLKHIKNVAEKQ